MNQVTGIQESKALLQKLNIYLNEEKILKDLSSYQVSKIDNYFKFIDEILKSPIETQGEILKVLAEHTKNEPKTVLGRFIPPILAFKQKLNRDPSEEEELFQLLISILSDFQTYSRWSIIEFIVNETLKIFPNDIVELRKHPQIKDLLIFLQDAVEKLKGKKETRDILKKILDIDKKDADSHVKYAKLISAEEPEESISYYKRAAEIYANSRKLDKLQEIWKILAENSFQDLKFFERVERTLISHKEFNFIIAHFMDLVEQYKSLEDWDIVIYLLKKIITSAIEQEKKEENQKRLQQRSDKRIHKKKEGRILSNLRAELTKAYREKYINHSLLNVFLKLSDITNPSKPLLISISNFEKYIVFDAGNYVYHNKRGVGKIKEINEKFVTIDFNKQEDQKMSLDMAMSSLKALAKSHIWVRYYENPEEIKTIFRDNKIEFFKILLESYNKKVSINEVKTEVINKFIKESEWNKWWQDARKALKESSLFGFNPKNKNEILMWERELSYSEELENRYKSVKEWDKKFEIALETLKSNTEITEKAAEMIAEDFLNQEETINSLKRIQIYLFLNLFSRIFPENASILNSRKIKEKNIIEILLERKYEDIKNDLEELKDNDFRKEYINLLIKSRSDYVEILLNLLLEKNAKLPKFIIDRLTEEGHIDNLEEFFIKIYNRFRDYTEPYLWFAKNILENRWDEEYKWINKSRIEILLQTFRLLKPLERIETKGNKLKNQALEIIFGTTSLTLENLKKSKIVEFLNGEPNFIKKFYYYLKDVSYIPQAYKENFLEFLKESRPDIENIESIVDTIEDEITTKELFPSDDIILITKESYDKRKQHLEHLIHVEMPENAREIGEAQAKGDLRENAEYKAALERQDKLRAEIKKVEEELKRAKIIDDSRFIEGVASIGSKVTLKDTDGNTITYTILGPWDVNPEENIISYASPLGKSILGKKVGETSETIMDKVYTIEKIERAI